MGVWDERGIATDNAATDATAPNEASDNTSAASVPPYMPNALPLSSNSAQLAARLYPMISNVLPNPAAKISIEVTPERKESVGGEVVNNSDSNEELNTEGDVINGDNDQPLSNLPLEQRPIPSAPPYEADTSPGEAIKKAMEGHK